MYKYAKPSILSAFCFFLIYRVPWGNRHPQKLIQAVCDCHLRQESICVNEWLFYVKDWMLTQSPNTSIRIAFTSNMIRAIKTISQEACKITEKSVAIPFRYSGYLLKA
jgi:hypothetical protein